MLSVEHGARLGITFGPAESFRRQLITIFQVLAGPGPVAVLVLVRMIDDAQLQRVHIQLVGQLIDRRLHGE
jgi:hypothetical protein